jgi:hypothetical protein
MARIAFATDTDRWSRWAVVVPAAWMLCIVFTPAPVRAGVGVGVAPTYPASIAVGDTNVPVSLSIKNTSDGPQAAGTLELSDIKHTPSCGSDTTPCPPADADKGVFALKGPATGRSGTACAGKTFTIGPADTTTGEVEFIPNGGAVVLQSPGNVNDTCTIDFFVDMLRLPGKDASPLDGIQTAQLARVSGTASVGPVNGTGTGAGLVTGLAETPNMPAPAANPAILGIVALLLGAYGTARLRRRTAAQAAATGKR